MEFAVVTIICTYFLYNYDIKDCNTLEIENSEKLVSELVIKST